MSEGVNPSQQGAGDEIWAAISQRAPVLTRLRFLFGYLGAFTGLIFGWVTRAAVVGTPVSFRDIFVNLFADSGPTRDLALKGGGYLLLLILGGCIIGVVIAYVSEREGLTYGRFVRGPQDFYGGLAIIHLSVLALWASSDLPGQRGFAFGPGTSPRLFAGLLAGLGAAVALVGVSTDGPRIEKYKVRGPVLVIIAIIAFAAMIRPLGLVISTFLAFLVSIFGSSEMRWLESLIAAAVMTLGCVLLFVYLLNLPFQLFPRF